MGSFNSLEPSSLTTFQPISVEYPEPATNHFHSFRYLPLDDHGSSTGADYESDRNYRPDRQPNLLRQTSTFQSGSSVSNRSDQNMLLRHMNDSVNSKFGSSWNDHIQTLGNSPNGLNNGAANSGFEWMHSPVLEQSSRGALHGSGHFIPRVSNSTMDRNHAHQSTGLLDVYAVSSSFSPSIVKPYHFRNDPSDAELWWPECHYVPHQKMLPHDRKDTHYKILHRDMIQRDMRPGSPSPSSFNYNTPMALPKRSSLPKNFDDLDLSSKNQIEEIRRAYDIKNQSEAAARKSANQSSSTKTREKSSQKPAFSGDVKYTLNKSSRRGEYPTLSLEFYKDFGLGDGLDAGMRKYSTEDGSAIPSVKLREDFDETQRRRKRNHIIFLVIVMLVVAIAVVSAVLASTLGATQGKLKEASQNYSIVVANLTLKIINRSFQVELLDSGSQEFKDLSMSYSTEVDRLFLKSKLAEVYSDHEILYFRNGSIYATSSITFIDDGLVKSPQDVENVISTAEIKSPDWKQEDDYVTLGEFFVCRVCAEVTLEYQTVHEKPKLMSTNSAQIGVSLNMTDAVSLEAPQTLSGATAATLENDSDVQQETKNQSFKIEADGPEHLTTVMQIDENPDESLQQGPTTASLIGDQSSDADQMTMITTADHPSGLSLDDGDVLIMCLVRNINGWTNISIWHQPNDPLTSRPFSPGALIMSLDPTGLTTYGPQYSDRVRSKYEVNGTQILLSVQLYHVTCKDIGTLRCLLTDRAGRTFPRFAKVDIAIPVSKPKLTVPPDVIENRSVTSEVRCEADTGHPPWKIKLSARLLNGSVVALPGEETVTVDSCTTLLVRTLSGFTPSMSLNGSVFECRIEKPNDPRDALWDNRTLFVTRENVCVGKSNPSYLPHPYNCSTYIECLDEVPSVKFCPVGQCFNHFLHKCTLDSKPLLFQTTHGVINYGLASLTCSFDKTMHWSHIGIGRKSPSGEHYDLVNADRGGQVTWQDSALRTRSVTSFHSTGEQIVLELWIFVLKCSDEGSYTCEVKSDELILTESVEFFVYGQSKRPTLIVPETAVQGAVEPAVVRCEAYLGRPAATLTLKVRPRGELQFTPVEFTKMLNVTNGSCLGKMSGEYVISTTESLNGSTFRCEVTPHSGIGQLTSETLSSEEREYFVLPNTTCSDVGSSLLPHPHDCRLFILCVQSQSSVLSCGPRHCFNVTSQQCDILAPGPTPAINDNSCSPTKSLDYLPHGSLCDKFLQCVYGNETVRHCPPSEMYSGNGTCTKDISKSYCYMHNRF